MKKVNTDEQFFSRFLRLQGKIQTISGVFQNPDMELSDDEIILWNLAADDAKEYLDKLISEGRTRMNWIEPPDEFCFVHEDYPNEILYAERVNDTFVVTWEENDQSIRSTVFKEREVKNKLNNKVWTIY